MSLLYLVLHMTLRARRIFQMVLPDHRSVDRIRDASEALKKLNIHDSHGETCHAPKPCGLEEQRAETQATRSHESDEVMPGAQSLCPRKHNESLISRLANHPTEGLHNTSKLGLIFMLSEGIYDKESPTLTLYAPIQRFRIRSKWSTVAILDRGTSLPVVQAMSGWGHDNEDDLSRISGRLWTEQVFLVADHIEHAFTPNRSRDQGRPGWFHASHAEKQAVAYVLRYHTSFKNEWGGSVAKKHTSSITAVARSVRQGIISPDDFRGKVKYFHDITDEDESLRGELQRHRITPLWGFDIIISKEAQCSDCKRFIEAVRKFFDLRITVHECSP